MDNDQIEDVERGADQSFFVAHCCLNSGRTDRNVDQILASDRTDRQTDRQTDTISILWAFLVFKKTEFGIWISVMVSKNVFQWWKHGEKKEKRGK